MWSGWGVAALSLLLSLHLATRRPRPLNVEPLPVAAPLSPLPAPPPPRPSTTPFADPATSIEDLVSRAAPAVVLIATPTATGSAFFVASDRLITNAHVVGPHPTVTLRFSDGQEGAAEVLNRSEDLDLAVLRLQGGRSAPAILPLAAGSCVRTGQEVVAIGSPHGMQNSVTRGIVSGQRQFGRATLVQTDAALHPGNSGGPLLDRTGTAIGIATSGVQDGPGLNFAVSAEHARALLEGH